MNTEGKREGMSKRNGVAGKENGVNVMQFHVGIAQVLQRLMAQDTHNVIKTYRHLLLLSQGREIGLSSSEKERDEMKERASGDGGHWDSGPTVTSCSRRGDVARRHSLAMSARVNHTERTKGAHTPNWTQCPP
jgi:hypothetical protein